MSLSEQIREMEGAISHYREQAESYEKTCNSLQDDNEDLTEALKNAEEFIAYIDKTNPELYTAYEAIRKLEGAKT